MLKKIDVVLKEVNNFLYIKIFFSVIFVMIAIVLSNKDALSKFENILLLFLIFIVHTIAWVADEIIETIKKRGDN